MSQRRRRPSGVNNSSNRGSTSAPMTQPARAPADAPVITPSQTSSFVVAYSSESGDELCSTPGCCRPRRYWRIDRDYFSGEQDCCPVCKAPPADATVASGEHSAMCNAFTLARWLGASSSRHPCRHPHHHRQLQRTQPQPHQHLPRLRRHLRRKCTKRNATPSGRGLRLCRL